MIKVNKTNYKSYADFGNFTIGVRIDNSIEVLVLGVPYDDAVKPLLREIAAKLGFVVVKSWNTRQLGAYLVAYIKANYKKLVTIGKYTIGVRKNNSVVVFENGILYSNPIKPLLEKTIAPMIGLTVKKSWNQRQLASEIIKRILNVGRIIYIFIMKRNCNHRYASYDFCYLYFQKNKGKLSTKNNIEKSCMYLWSYLASWGMLRGSSALLQCSPAALKPLIEYFDSLYKSASHIWDIDVDTYNVGANKKNLLDTYKDIENILSKILSKKPTVTLVTKIMLVVFGNVPAFDTYFKNAFSKIYGVFSSFGIKELDAINDFYSNFKILLDSIKINVIDFNGKPTNIIYKKAKLIDMYGFTKR